jgi:hypothetical protein
MILNSEQTLSGLWCLTLNRQIIMKKHCKFYWLSKKYIIGILTVALISILNDKTCAQDTNTTYKIKPEDVIVSVHVKWFEMNRADRTAREFTDERKRLNTELLEIFKDPKTSNYNQCSCAYYLGEMRASEAVDALAASITLELDTTHILIGGIPLAAYDPAMNALVKIGSPAIPALIRNLAESDDAKVRGLSLQVIYRIEGDKDIVQLRLQKAFAAEKDSQKQTRIQLALKALAETSFTN